MIGSVILYRSYAYYEEKAEYNVLKGQIGDFTKEDVQFAFLVDGSSSITMPQKDSGYYFTGVTCTNNATASWNAVDWSIEVENITNTNQSLIVDNISATKYVDPNTTPAVLQGENEFAIMGPVHRGGLSAKAIKGDNNSIILIEFNYSNLISSSISNLQIYLNRQYYTLKSAVEAGKIKPMVLMTNYLDVAAKNKISNLGNNPVNLYDGGEFVGQFPLLQVYFMLEQEVILKGVKFESDRGIKVTNGDFVVRKIDNMIMHLSE